MALMYGQEKGYPDNSARKNFVFMAYPYTPPLSLDDYRNVTNEIQDELPVRIWYFLDEVTSNEMMRKIWRSILRSDISFFDISGGNPNVSFEMGLSLAIEKRSYALFKTGSTNPLGSADLGYAERLEYSSVATLKGKIAEVLKTKSTAIKLFKDMSYSYYDTNMRITHPELEAKIVAVVNNVFKHKTINRGTAKDILGMDDSQTTTILNALRSENVFSIIPAKRYSKYEFTSDWVYKDHEVAGD